MHRFSSALESRKMKMSLLHWHLFIEWLKARSFLSFILLYLLAIWVRVSVQNPRSCKRDLSGVERSGPLHFRSAPSIFETPLYRSALISGQIAGSAFYIFQKGALSSC